LLGNSVHLPGGEITAKVGNWTTLIILSQGTAGKYRIKDIQDKANKVKSALETENSQIGNIVIASFSTAEDLEKVSIELVEKAIQTGTQKRAK
jgi:hypothetical protein